MLRIPTETWREAAFCANVLAGDRSQDGAVESHKGQSEMNAETPDEQPKLMRTSKRKKKKKSELQSHFKHRTRERDGYLVRKIVAQPASLGGADLSLSASLPSLAFSTRIYGCHGEGVAFVDILWRAVNPLRLCQKEVGGTKSHRARKRCVLSLADELVRRGTYSHLAVCASQPISHWNDVARA